MKSRKTMTHANLVAEVIEQTRKRGAVELGEIKKNIESKFFQSRRNLGAMLMVARIDRKGVY
jgi:hypothetical protein